MLIKDNTDKSGFWCVAKKMIHNYFLNPAVVRSPERDAYLGHKLRQRRDVVKDDYYV
jgi:hypothetical protein